MQHSFFTTEFLWLIPEVFLAIFLLCTLLAAVFSKDQPFSSLCYLLIFGFIITLAFVVNSTNDSNLYFSNEFLSNGLTRFTKIALLSAGAGVILLLTDHPNGHVRRPIIEYPILIGFAVLAMMLLVSANSFLTFYLCIEFQSLCLYVLAAFERDRVQTAEAGIKYFILGALASGIMLYGMSLIYGFSGALNFHDVAKNLTSSHIPGITLGLVMMLAGFAFKLSAAPFHMWAPDVYQGVPTPVTAFFVTAPKFAATIILVRILFEVFPAYASIWQPFVMLLSIFSMIVGALGAMQQYNIKRLLAYSSIGHAGYLLIGIAAHSKEGISAILLYLAVYLVSTVGMFACILMLRQHEGPDQSIRFLENIDDYRGLGKRHPIKAFCITVFLLSMAGIPPLAGFFGKFYIFLSAIQAELFALAIIGVLTSVLATFYYLNIIKKMYFDEPAEELMKETSIKLTLISGAAAMAVVVFCIFPYILIKYTNLASMWI